MVERSLRLASTFVDRAARSKVRNHAAAGLVSIAAAVGATSCAHSIYAQNFPAAPVIARWSFRVENGAIQEQVSSTRCPFEGNVYPGTSPVGAALQLDGYTAKIQCQPIRGLSDVSPLGVSAWVRLDAYPWNAVPVIAQSTPFGSFYFGVDATGHLLVQSRRAGPIAVSSGVVPLRTWSLVTVNIGDHGPEFSINGSSITSEEPSKALAATVSQEVSVAGPGSITIGSVPVPVLPGEPSQIHPDLPVHFSIEGAVGDLAIYAQPITQAQITDLLRSANAAMRMPAPWPELPRWTGGPGKFGAFFTTLHFDPLWDSGRRIGPDSDVVVRFEDSPVQLVFWQGTNYVPAWVTENNNWYTDEFMEIFGHPRCPFGEDCEPMSDKHAHYSHVRILQSSPARTIVHWRYALSEVENYAIGDATSPDSWGDWADEYWIIYPDHVAVRRSVLWSTAPERLKTEFQESIVIIPPGKAPEDCLNLDAVTMENLRGEAKTYSWELKSGTGLSLPHGPKSFPEPKDAVIQVVNLKSRWKPFEVVWGDDTSSDVYNGEPSISSFEWWNHWPVAQIPSSGRPALAADRAGHTSVSHLYWPPYRQDEATVTKLLLSGLTELPAEKLAVLARSWRSPPELRLQNGTLIPYDPAQRAWVVPADVRAPLNLVFAADGDHPIDNPAIVVKGWTGAAKVSLSGSPDSAESVRQGSEQSLEGSDLVVYLPIVSDHAIRLSIAQP